MADTLTMIFSSVIGTSLDIYSFIICTIASLILGLLSGLSFMFKNRCSKGLVSTLAILPLIVQAVIMMVNGNLGIGVAVAGAFSLIRFRSAPGSAKEIAAVFLSMAIGLATGTGFVGIAAVFTVIAILVSMLYTATNFGERKSSEKLLKVTIPESLDYSGLFDDLFDEYTSTHELVSVRTTNMGSLYKLDYSVTLKDSEKEKEFIDEIRCRNGNLEIACGKVPINASEL